MLILLPHPCWSLGNAWAEGYKEPHRLPTLLTAFASRGLLGSGFGDMEKADVMTLFFLL